MKKPDSEKADKVYEGFTPLYAEDVAEAVWLMLSARTGAVFDEINLSPQKKVIRFPKPGGE